MMAVTRRRAVVLLLCGLAGVLAYSAPAFAASAGALLLAGPLEAPAGSPTKTLGAAPTEVPKTGPGSPGESYGSKPGAPGAVGSEAGGVIQSAPSPPPAASTISLESPFKDAPVLSPEQASADAASRLAFTGLGREAALALAKRDFHLETPSWTAPGSESGSHIARYLGTNTASEERPGGGHVLVQSTLPLQTTNGSGALAPVSTTLHDTGGAYEPANPLVPLSISKDAAGGASFLSSGITVAPVSAAASEAPVVVGNRLMWTGTATDTDFISEPLPGGTGVEDSWQLRSQNSPQDNALVFKLPPGASLQMSTTVPGGAEAVMEGRPLLLIPPASAHGADGRSIPATYSVNGDTLTTHVELSDSVDFPVLVDPEVIGYYGEAGGDGAWQNWHTYSTCGGCFSFSESSNLIQAGAEVGWPEGNYGEWYIAVRSSDLARMTRVDVTGLIHSPENQATLNIGLWGSNGTEIYSENGYAGATGSAPLRTDRFYDGQSMAFCAQEAGGYDGGPQPLCKECKHPEVGECEEAYGGLGFWFSDDLLASRNEFNYASISSATIRYIQTSAPTVSTAESNVLDRWVSGKEPPYIKVRGEDKGVGISAVGVDAVSGAKPKTPSEMPTPSGSSLAPGTSPYTPSCNDPWCTEWASSGYYLSGLSTGVWTLGAWAHNAVSKEKEELLAAYVDKTPPVISEPSWNNETLGDGAHVLKFSAKDGSVGAPQSGAAWMEMYVDGKFVKSVEQNREACPKPEGAYIIQTEPCYSLSGEWTLQGEDYGAGPHTVTIRAEDWAGNWEEKSFDITVARPVGNSQKLGPGVLNLRSGDYTLGATDVSLPAGTASLSISRSYSSQSKEPAGPLGPGWLLSAPDGSAAGQWQSLQVLSTGAVEAMTTDGQKVLFTQNERGEYVSPTGFQTYTLTEPQTSPATYQITDSGGDYTQFEEPAGMSAFMPTTVAQASGAGGLNKVTYVLREGKTSEIVGPVGAGESCSGTLSEGCRVLTLHYATSTTASGESSGEWGSYAGHLASVSFTAEQSKMVPITVAEYAYDKQGRLRAEWDPRISPALKTVYGYDAEGHVTALTPPGQQPWTFTYGTISGDPSTGRLLAVTRAQPVGATNDEIKSKLKEQGEQEKNTEAPKLSGSAVLGVKMSVTRGAWSNSPVAYGYQWEDCNSSGEACSPILGAVNPTYTPVANDTGHTLVVQVTATNGGGSVSAASAPSATIGTPVYSSQFGTEGTGNGQFRHPGDVALDAKGDLWVLDSGNNRVEEFSEAGSFIKTFGFGVSNGEAKFEICTSSCRAGVSGSNYGQLSSPNALAIDSKGNVWVADTGNSRIEEFNEKGEYLQTIGTPGSGSGQLNRPEGVAVDAHGNVWVSDTYNHRLEVFTELGWSSTIVTSSHLEEPQGIAIDSHGNVWVADWRGGVDEFNESGSWLNTFTGSGENRLENPYGIAVESNGNVLVVDAKHNRVELFSEKGEYETQFGSTGSGAGQLSMNYPMGLAGDSHGDVWVTDSNNNRIEKWTPPSAGTEGEAPPAPSARWTVEYGVPVSGSGAAYPMSSAEVAKWGQSDAPAEATAIFPPDKTEGWPVGAAEDYKQHATVSYFDSAERLVNTAAPGGAISMTQYDAYDNVERSLTAGNRQRALESSEPAKEAELLETRSKYESEGAELESRTGPQHEVKLANGTVTQARAHTLYRYEEGAPAPGGEVHPDHVLRGGEWKYTTVEIPYRLVTETSEGALLSSGEEKDVRTIKDSYSGQNGLGWELHKPTSVTVEPEQGEKLTRNTVYSPETGDVVETRAPGANIEAVYPPVFSKSFGSEGTGEGQFRRSVDVAVDGSGNAWVVDRENGRLEKFSSEGTFRGAYGSKGSGANQMEGAWDIAVNQGTGNVYVGDTWNNRIDEFSSAGAFIQTVGWGVKDGKSEPETCKSNCKGGIAGSGNGELNYPVGITVDSHGDVWVVDAKNDRVEEYSEAGVYLAQFGSKGSGEGQLNEPEGLAISEGEVYVVDGGNSRVEEFSSSGAYLRQFGSKGSSAGQFKEPTGIAVNPNNADIYVTDELNDRVEEFTPAGKFLLEFGAWGTGPGQFENPAGVAVGSNGDIYVSEDTGNRVDLWIPPGAGGAHMTYSTQFGSAGSGSEQFNYPVMDAIDGQGNVWITDANHARVKEFTAQGKFVASYGSYGNGEGQFESPSGIAINQGTGNVYVSDCEDNRIEELSSSGGYLRTIGGYGSEQGKLDCPGGVKIDTSGDVWVVDSHNNRIQEFSSTGTFMAAYGSKGSGNIQFEDPMDIALSGSNLYVADSGNRRVQELSTSGTYIAQFGTKGDGGGQFVYPESIATDATGHLYVVDFGNDRVEEFNASGQFLASFGSHGSGSGQLTGPRGIAINSAGDAYVADSENNRIEVWAPESQAVHDTKTIYYTAKGEAEVATCQNHPEWIGLPCQTAPAAQPEDALPNLPVSTVTYNIWDETETTTEKVGTSERKSTQTYDAAGRLKESSISSTTGRSVPTTTDEYSEETGALIKQSAGGKSITSAYNTLGQLTSYTDATGTTATYEYEKEGDDRLTKTNDGKGTQTYEYDKTTGQITTMKDSGAGTFSATYNTERQIANETYPNGMKATYTYNPVDQTTALAYTKGSSTWYKDETMLSIHGQSLSQTTTLGSDSYTYDGIGRMTQVQETPTGKGCTTYLYAYDADSNRVGETKREPGTGGACATEGGATTAHSYDEADRLIDPGTAYEPLGENTIVPAADAGGHALESSYYANGAIYSQTQNEQTNTYLLDPTGRVLEATAVKGMSSKTTISHYPGTGSTPAWTETEGSWTRNITGIGTGLAATQTNGGEAVIQLANLHGDIIGTVPDNSGAESATLASEPTAFGVPTTTSNQKYGWLGAGGLQTEFLQSGITSSSARAYIPQLGLHLEPQGLSGAAAQDPVNEYLEDMTLAQPIGTRTGTLPGAIEPLPANDKIAEEFEQNPPWDRGPSNAPEELVDPSILLTSSQASWLARTIREGNIAAVVSAPFLGEFGEILQIALDSGLSDIANNIADGLENCVEALYVSRNSPDSKYNRCKLYANVNFSLSPVTYGVETCFGVPHRRKVRYYCAGDSLTRN